MHDDFAKSVVEDMIHKYANVEEILRNFEGFDVFMLANGATVRLPPDFRRIPYDEVVLIADVKLGISIWEFDYWIGQQFGGQN